MTVPRIGSLCTGYGGLDTAVQAVFGGQLAWTADIDPGASQIIAHRYPGVPNLRDIKTTDWQQVRHTFGRPDIVCGGYPCQPFSTAGLRKGTEDERHLWPYIAHALGVLRPRYAIFENVAGHLRLGFDTVLADLARLGFDAEWCLAGASEVGAPHRRERLFILAAAADAPHLGHQRSRSAWTGGAGSSDGHSDDVRASHGDWGRFRYAIRRWECVLGRPVPSSTDARGRLSPVFVEWLMGLPAGHVTDVPGLTRTAQLKALGNGVVPQQAEAAIRLLRERAAAEPLAVAA